MKQLAVYNFIPSFCANCGETTGLKRTLSHEEIRKGYANPARSYQERNSHECPKCKTLYQLADTHAIAFAARSSAGDLHYHINMSAVEVDLYAEQKAKPLLAGLVNQLKVIALHVIESAEDAKFRGSFELMTARTEDAKKLANIIERLTP